MTEGKETAGRPNTKRPMTEPATGRSPRRRVLLIAAGLTMTALGFVLQDRFSAAMRRAEQRTTGRSALVPTPFGQLEYAIAGSGAPLLMIHGTGGGFDQGLRFSSAIERRGHLIIAPSRFGYLRSDFPNAPSSENQADAFATLVDHLQIDRLPVAGGSAGALSAIQFALRHPERCSALILLVPAGNVDDRDPVEMSGFQKALVTRLVRSDALYWSLLAMAPDQLIGTLLATDPMLVHQAAPAERRRVDAILDDMMPIHKRSRGMLNDARLAGSPAKIDFRKIEVPVSIISVEDDRFGTAATSRAIAARIPGAQLTIYPSGGHIWVGHDDDVADRVERFLEALEAPISS